MSVRAIDSNGDWTWGKNQSNYLTKNNAIMQNISTRLKSFKFDWFLDEQKNIDWINLLGKYGTEPVIQSEAERVIIQTQDVLSCVVTSSTINEKTRELKLSYTVKTIYTSSFSDSTTLDI